MKYRLSGGGLIAVVVLALLVNGMSLRGFPPAPGSNDKPTAADQPVAQKDNAPAAPAQPTLDVIVVGAGISGLSAALDLGRGGAKVTVVDMASVFGGHAVMSQGSLCIVDSPTQQQLGIKDSPELAFQDFHRWGEDPATDWVRYYVDNSKREIWDWVTELEVRFPEVLASSGNSVPREHQPAGRGIGLVTPIYRGCLELETIDFLWNGKVVQLLTTDGRVNGVLVRDVRTGEERQLHAKAVILATGGFQSNLDMVREFWPAQFRFPEKILAGSGRNSIGLGHQMAKAVGADLTRMDYQWNYYTGLPDPRAPGTNRGLNATNLYGILVNSEGKQFVNFHAWAKEGMPALFKQKQATCWCIFDETSKPNFSVSGSDWADFKKVDKLILQDPKLVKKADTLEKLAELSGLPVDALVSTVARYNQQVEQGEDKEFGRFGPGKSEFSNMASPKIMTPPFYAMQTYPLTRKSMGGVAIDMSCRVVDQQKKPIPGLYAVGELAGLAGINGKAALEGTFLGPCILTGRVSARTILKELAENIQPVVSSPSRCSECHNMKKLLAQPREGYWHFESVHKMTQERGLDCRHCHSDLTPYREDNHKINRQSLTAACVLCHTGRE